MPTNTWLEGEKTKTQSTPRICNYLLCTIYIMEINHGEQQLQITQDHTAKCFRSYMLILGYHHPPQQKNKIRNLK